MDENISTSHKDSRRSFLIKGSMAAAGLILSSLSNQSFASGLQNLRGTKWKGVQIGVITYSYRSMPHDIHQLLKYVKESGLHGVELMGDAMEKYAGRPSNAAEVAVWRAQVSMNKFKEVKKMYNKAGIDIYAFKPDALGVKNTDAEIEYAFRAAHALGARSVTVELPNNPDQTKRLGALAAKHKIYVGYHAHTQATDTLWDVALNQSPYNSMNLDCGHYIAAGGNNTKESLLALIEARHDRISSMHMKDRQLKSNGGANLPWGEGDTPIKEILTLLRDKKYDIPVSIELEYPIPDGSDAVKEVRKCSEFAQKALKG